MCRDETVRELKERWEDLTSWVIDDVKTRWWQRLMAAYTEPHRKYHTLTHLHKMFQHYDSNKDSLKDRYSCAYAIFFHDIVYNPKSKDNEAQSAEVFKQFTQETTLDSAHYITDLIEATASHCTEAHLDKNSFGSDDIHFFLDFDMSVLGSDPKEYDEYCEQIREEYSYMNAKDYVDGRLKILQLFLQIPNIFATKDFRESYEEKARNNIQREIERLKEASSS